MTTHVIVRVVPKKHYISVCYTLISIIYIYIYIYILLTFTTMRSMHSPETLPCRDCTYTFTCLKWFGLGTSCGYAPEMLGGICFSAMSSSDSSGGSYCKNGFPVHRIFFGKMRSLSAMFLDLSLGRKSPRKSMKATSFYKKICGVQETLS